MRAKPNSISFVAAAFVLTLSGAAHAETTVGRWCDKMIPTMPQFNSIIEIVITDNSAIELRTRHGDGSSAVYVLNEQGGGIYAKAGSSSKDKYRVVASDGNLQLLDRDGLIRIATRLENTPRLSECGM